MTIITLDENRLCITTDYRHKDQCKALPGARWSPAIKQWTIPATPSAAQALALVFPPATARWNADSLAILAEAEQLARAAAHKAAESLPPIPQVKTAPWLHQLRAFWFVVDLFGGLPDANDHNHL